MKNFELVISRRDWMYIVIIGTFFGFFISLIFYFLVEAFRVPSTILFSVVMAAMIALFASFFITVSNHFILPKVDKKFWYLISFCMSFLSGVYGFLLSFVVFSYFEAKIIDYIYPYWGSIALSLGFLTFLIGLILHQFTSMKYKNDAIAHEMLSAKLKALENELNPHFLFNALNSVSELIYIDQKKAESAVLSLSQFLRNAIKQESLIPVEIELEMVKTYVSIENIRFGDKIVLHIQNNATKSYLVPKFSLQLLVENSIKHSYNLGVLNIWISLDNDAVCVSNDCFVSKQELIFGTGLRNLCQRLEFFHVGTLHYELFENTIKFTIRIKHENHDS